MQLYGIQFFGQMLTNAKWPVMQIFWAVHVDPIFGTRKHQRVSKLFSGPKDGKVNMDDHGRKVNMDELTWLTWTAYMINLHNWPRNLHKFAYRNLKIP